MGEHEPLFVAEGRASEVDVLLMEDELGPGAVDRGQGEVALPFREPSYLSIGEPVVVALDPQVEASVELRRQFDEFEFHQVQLTCSFQAAVGSRFTHARFTTELVTTVDGGERSTGAQAIAYDLFPLRLEEARTVTVTSQRPGVDVTFGFEPVEATLSLPSRERMEEGIQYTSRVEAFDLRGTRPAWSFRRTEQREISGPHRLFMLVRKPKGTTVQATFGLSATVQFMMGGHGFAPVDLLMLFRARNRSGVLTDEPSVPLC
ncbi:hypothetical protein [Streptomyces sp. NPDC000618]|uniref:hypothetical protein n=1 Tax=Streptomyces sp. NPDC000618 TaxID=3154265 RepID=UPI00331AB042